MNVLVPRYVLIPAEEFKFVIWEDYLISHGTGWILTFFWVLNTYSHGLNKVGISSCNLGVFQLVRPFVWNAAGEVRIWTCNLGVYSDTFIFWHFPTTRLWHLCIPTQSNSETFLILTLYDSNSYRIWHFQLPILRSCVWKKHVQTCPIRTKCVSVTGAAYAFSAYLYAVF